MGSIEDSLNRIVEAITPRGLGGHGPRKVKVSLLPQEQLSTCTKRNRLYPLSFEVRPNFSEMHFLRLEKFKGLSALKFLKYQELRKFKLM